MPINSDILKKYRNKLKIFIETGTSLGLTVQLAIKEGFELIYSIELDNLIHKKVFEEFKPHSNIKLLCGESQAVLADLLKDIKEPCVFWLDAHPPTGSAPILKELEVISCHPIKNNVILIDDMRCFGNELTPQKEEVIQAVININPNYRILYEKDACAEKDILIATE